MQICIFRAKIRCKIQLNETFNNLTKHFLTLQDFFQLKFSFREHFKASHTILIVKSNLPKQFFCNLKKKYF